MSVTNTVRIRLMLDDEIALGPGKADLLDAIGSAGSISAAARTLDMSYRRAWLLVDAMNGCFARPLVESAKGGTGGGGARVTETGLEVLAAFRNLQREVDAVVAARAPAFLPYLRKPVTKPKRSS